jgi:transposase
MSRELVPDALWSRVAPLLPARPPRPKGGRPPCDDRACLRGILFVLRTGLPWEWLPREVLGVSGVTCWRRLRDWALAGVLEALQLALLDELGEKGRIDWSRAAVDSFSVPTKKGGP